MFLVEIQYRPITWLWSGSTAENANPFINILNSWREKSASSELKLKSISPSETWMIDV